MPPTKRLLVADDSLIIQKVIRLALANEGYDIQAISDGDDAVQQISVLRPSVVLIDVTLPGKNAFEVKRAVNSLVDLKDVRFILMSSAYEKVDEGQIKELGFDGRLTKPFDPPHLRQLLNSVLGTGPSAPPGSASSLKTRTPPIPTLPESPPSGPGSAFPNLPPLPPSGLSQPPPPALSNSNPLPSFPPLPNFDLNDTQRGWEPPAADSILDPIQPMEPPPVPTSYQTPEAPPFLPPLPPSQSGSDEDIKHLTESTIRMSGLDDFQWSIQEPSMRPVPTMSDIGGSTFPVSDLSRFSSPFSSEEPEEPTQKIIRPERRDPEVGPSGHSIAEIVHSPEFERLVQAQVRAQLEQLAQHLLPQIAENVLKQEINRLLSEMP